MMIDLKHIAYLIWLTSQIEAGPKEYGDLFRLLHRKQFVWIVPNDDNRVMDALDLRKEFYNGEAAHEDIHDGASVLEVIVALSRRVAFDAGGYPEEWAWTLIKNLGLDRFPDPITKRKEREVDDILEALIWRTYERNGTGGFFPLMNREVDQTKVEIWYQMSAYIQEKHLV